MSRFEIKISISQSWMPIFIESRADFPKFSQPDLPRKLSWTEYRFKTKNKSKHKIPAKQSNIFKKITSFLSLKQQIIRLAQGHWSCTLTH